MRSGLFCISTLVSLLLSLGILSSATQGAPKPAPESRWEQLWEERISIDLLNTSTICAAVYAGKKEESDRIGLLIKDRPESIDYATRYKTLESKMRNSIEISSIKDSAKRETFINNVINNIIVQAEADDTSLGILAGMCDTLFHFKPTPAFYQYKGGPIQTVSHIQCAERYSALVFGFAQSNRPFAEGMNQRAQYSMGRHEGVLARVTGIQHIEDATRKDIQTNVLMVAKSEVESARGDDSAIRKLFIEARTCDAQYGLQPVPIPGEGKSRE